MSKRQPTEAEQQERTENAAVRYAAVMYKDRADWEADTSRYHDTLAKAVDKIYPAKPK